MNGQNENLALTPSTETVEILTPPTSEELEYENQYEESITSLYGVRCYKCSIGCCPDRCFEYGEQDLEEAHHNKMEYSLKSIQDRVRPDFIEKPRALWFSRFKKIINGKTITSKTHPQVDLGDLRQLCRENYDRAQNRHHNAGATKWFLNYSYLDCVRFIMCDYDLALYKHRLRTNFFN
jgi:hypothetical protein